MGRTLVPKNKIVDPRPEDPENIGKARRAKTSRLYRFWCWFWYGHAVDETGRSMNRCPRCGAYWPGPD